MKFIGLVSLVAGLRVTPTQKVIQLLNDIHAKGKKEKQDEEVRFTRFSQWSADTAEARDKAVKKGNARIEQLNNAIAKANADANAFGKNIEELQASIATWQAEQKAATEIREKENSDYQATHVDYSESLDALGRAVHTLKAQNVDRAQAESLLQVVKAQKRVSLDSRRAIDSLLQLNQEPDFLNRAAPEANAYEFQSSGVVDLLEQLKDKFTKEKRDLEREEADKKHAYEQLSQTLTDNVENATSESKDRAHDKAGREADAAEGEKDLAETTVVRDEDKKYLDDLNAQFRQKSADYENRHKLRGEELEAITKAVEILSSSAVSGAADKHLPAMLQKATSFLVLRSKLNIAPEVRKSNVLAFLRERGSSVDSRLLSLLATKIEANPFEKVKKMIYDMIIRLQEEATEETEHKGWCDTELGVNKVTRDSKTEDIEKLTARSDKLSSRIAKLTQSVADLTQAISETDSAVAEATSNRNEEKEKNAETIQDAKEAQVAVSEALKVLKQFYDQAASATSLVQSRSPADDAPETFDKPYQGQQDSSTGVIGLLEVIHSDFARLQSETEASEDASSREFKDFANESEIDRATKAQQVENKNTSKTQAEGSLNATKKDLAGTQQELDAARAYYDKLKPSCVDSGATYEERVAKREEEIQSLKEALEIVTSSN